MAKYAFLYIDDGVEHQGDPTPEQQRVYAEIFKWFEANGDKFVDDGAELQPTRTATTIRKQGGNISVVDGPFAEAKESVGGFSILDLPDRAAAHLYHAARAELLRELGRPGEARAADRRALALTENPAERALLERRIAQDR